MSWMNGLTNCYHKSLPSLVHSMVRLLEADEAVIVTSDMCKYDVVYIFFKLKVHANSVVNSECIIFIFNYAI